MVKQMGNSEIESLVSRAKASSNIAIDVITRTATSVLEEAFQPESSDHSQALHMLVNDVKGLISSDRLTEPEAYRLTMLLLWTLGRYFKKISTFT
jgi:hypothetical protein